jgi:2Fe-2S ferredoxin
MPIVTAEDREGCEHSVQAANGVALMRILKYDGGLEIEAVCGGSAMCGTCHVYVSPDWYERLPPAGEIESELLDNLVHVTARSRLSCQITMEDSLDGLKVTLAPEE